MYPHVKPSTRPKIIFRFIYVQARNASGWSQVLIDSKLLVVEPMLLWHMSRVIKQDEIRAIRNVTYDRKPFVFGTPKAENLKRLDRSTLSLKAGLRPCGDCGTVTI